MSDICLLVGLGNPGVQYENTRHNVGFSVIDLIAGTNGCSAFKKISPLGEITSFTKDNRKIILARPLTFMNLSGRAVRFLSDFYKIPLQNIYIFHDDLDLELGRIKIKKGGGNGGHNGLKSIDELCGKDYWRIRIGIGRPMEKSAIVGYVLGKFDKTQTEILDEVSHQIADNFSMIFSEPEKLVSICNQ